MEDAELAVNSMKSVNSDTQADELAGLHNSSPNKEKELFTIA
jgi:hypothetical protein